MAQDENEDLKPGPINYGAILWEELEATSVIPSPDTPHPDTLA